MQSNTLTGKISFMTRMLCAVLLRPKLNRGKMRVLQEYSNGWNQYRWYLEQARSLEQWLRVPGVEDVPAFCNVNQRLSYEAFDSIGYYRHHLLAALRKYFSQARSITEFDAARIGTVER